MPSHATTGSHIAADLAKELLDEHKQLTPEERLAVFLNHNRLVAQIQEAGELKRKRSAEPRDQ